MTRDQILKQKALFTSFIVPVFNEEKNLNAFVKALGETAQKLTEHYEIILIDDGSRDNSLALIEAQTQNDARIKMISLSRNFGKENALTAGLEHCQGDVAIMIDADFQHPFSTIDEFLANWSLGYDMVYAVRKDRRNESRLKRFLTQGFYRLIDRLSATKIPMNASDFRLLDRKVINAINDCREYNRFMKGLYAWVGFKSIAVTYEVQNREGGASSFSFKRLLELALTGIFSFSNIPLRIWSLIGLFISSISFVYALFIVFDTLIFGVDTPGYATIVVAIMFFGGVQLLSIGILGEYIGRIFSEVKKRPKYLIDKSIGFEK